MLKEKWDDGTRSSKASNTVIKIQDPVVLAIRKKKLDFQFPEWEKK